MTTKEHAMLELSDRKGRSLEDEGAWLMFHELNHRVGNELMVALAALRIARRAFDDMSDPTAMLDQAIARFEKFEEVHYILNPARAHGTLNQRLETLCLAKAETIAAPRGIHLTLGADDVIVDEKTAWTICVVVSELLTNVFKHAFADGRPGLVVVSLRATEDKLIVSVADNGVGVVAAPAQRTSGGGWSIIAKLAQRLEGTVNRRSGPTGTEVIFQIPLRHSMQ
ncbi:sensor histidine kinase [Rhizorhabdus argentea]|uniref:sensor histidine kinase n=1 Tax=Rhizorhabdus argentea TaxID=1387174 RepID=UPI0030EE3427